MSMEAEEGEILIIFFYPLLKFVSECAHASVFLSACVHIYYDIIKWCETAFRLKRRLSLLFHTNKKMTRIKVCIIQPSYYWYGLVFLVLT